jgi:hypothetical protein
MYVIKAEVLSDLVLLTTDDAVRELGSNASAEETIEWASKQTEGSFSLNEYAAKTRFNFHDDNGFAPLHMAVFVDSWKIIEFLFKISGIDADIRTIPPKRSAVEEVMEEESAVMDNSQ